MTIQRPLRLPVSRLPGESPTDQKTREVFLNNPPPKIPPEKLFADLLKRLARRVMADVTACQPVNITAHMERLNDLREVIEFASRHEFISGNETLRSDKQLIYAATVADFLECLNLTRQQHRAPDVVSRDDDWQQRVERKLDAIAGFLATNEQAQELFNPGGES
jgi:hypothetical protein